MISFLSSFCLTEHDKSWLMKTTRDETHGQDSKIHQPKINVCDIEKLLGPSNRKIDSELSRRGSDLITFMQNFAKEMKDRRMAKHTVQRGKYFKHVMQQNKCKKGKYLFQFSSIKIYFK